MSSESVLKSEVLNAKVNAANANSGVQYVKQQMQQMQSTIDLQKQQLDTLTVGMHNMMDRLEKLEEKLNI